MEEASRRDRSHQFTPSNAGGGLSNLTMALTHEARSQGAVRGMTVELRLAHEA